MVHDRISHTLHDCMCHSMLYDRICNTLYDIMCHTLYFSMDHMLYDGMDHMFYDLISYALTPFEPYIWLLRREMRQKYRQIPISSSWCLSLIASLLFINFIIWPQTWATDLLVIVQCHHITAFHINHFVQVNTLAFLKPLTLPPPTLTGCVINTLDKNEITIEVNHLDVLSFPKSMLYRNVNVVHVATASHNIIQDITL